MNPLFLKSIIPFVVYGPINNMIDALDDDL